MAACSAADQFLSAHARKGPAEPAERLLVRVPVAQVPALGLAVFGARCIPRASIQPALLARVRECRGGPVLVHRVPEWEARPVWAHRRRPGTVRRADISSGAAPIIVTKNPRKVQ